MDLPWRSVLRHKSEFTPPTKVGAADVQPVYARRPDCMKDAFVVMVNKADEPVLALINSRGEVIQKLFSVFTPEGDLNRVGAPVYVDADGHDNFRIIGHITVLT